MCHSFIGFFKRNLEGALNLINIYRKLRVYIVFSLINGSMYKATEVHFLKLRFQCPNMSIVLYNRFIFQHKRNNAISRLQSIFLFYTNFLWLSNYQLETWIAQNLIICSRLPFTPAQSISLALYSTLSKPSGVCFTSSGW